MILSTLCASMLASLAQMSDCAEAAPAIDATGGETAAVLATREVDASPDCDAAGPRVQRLRIRRARPSSGSRNENPARDLPVVLPEGPAAGEESVVGRRLQVAFDVERP